MAIVIPNTFSANTLIKSAEVNTNFSTLGAASPWASNPISAAGDLIVGASAGVSTTLPAGAANQVLKVVNGVPTWATFTGGINYIAANPDFEADTSGWITYNDTKAVTITNASPAVFTSASAHGYALGQPVAFVTTGGLPSGLTAGTRYYVSSVPTTTTYTVSATLGGANIDTTTAGTGTHTQCPLTPITGNTGTAAGLALTRSTSSPLRGTASGLLTQTNATVVAGQGTSFAFTIDPADKAKVLQVSLDFNASVDFTPSSGQVGSHSDLEVSIKDVTNSVLIPVSSNLITANGPNNFTYQGTFQSSSNSVSYILCIHAATANSPATGFKFKFDNIVVGPQHTVEGAAITDWQAYTPQFDGLGTVTSPEIEFRQVGDTYEIRGKFVAGTVTAAEARIGLPNNRTSADTSKIPSIQIAGQLGRDGTALPYSIIPILIQPSVTYLNIGGNYAAGTASSMSILTAQTGSGIINNSELISFFASVPIAGLSSNVQLSQDTDTRVVAAKAGILTPASASATVPVNFDLIYHDTHSAISIVSGVWSYKVPVSGIYSIGISVANNQANAASTYDAYLNGVLNTSLTEANTDAHRNTSGSCDIKCVAGDILDIRPNTTVTPSATSVINGSVVSIHRLSGPATIAASETVAARYVDATATLTSTLSLVTFSTKSFDTHAAYSGGVFTCPSSGKYSVKVCLSVTGSYTGGGADYGTLDLYQNGSIVTEEFAYAISGSGVMLKLSDEVACNAGDTLEIKASTNGSAPTVQNGLNRTYLSIIRAGN